MSLFLKRGEARRWRGEARRSSLRSFAVPLRFSAFRFTLGASSFAGYRGYAGVSDRRFDLRRLRC